MPNEIKLDELFFAVCQTAIKNCSWKYADFEKVRAVEGQLAALKAAVFVSKPAEATEPANLSAPAAIEQPAPVKEAPAPTKAEVLNDSAFKPADKVLTPEEAKEAPVRKMPDEILSQVADGIEIAKNPPKVRDVKVEDLPSDPDEARAAFNKPM